MSIDGIKKKAKLSLDEMYDEKEVSSLSEKKTVKPKNQKTGKLENQQPNLKPSLQISFESQTPESGNLENNIYKKQEAPLDGKAPGVDFEIHTETRLSKSSEGDPRPHLVNKLENHGLELEKQQDLRNSRPQKILKVPYYKMTFNLPVDIYDAFHGIYAQRILEGYKTKKEDLISEAITLLIDKEKKLS